MRRLALLILTLIPFAALFSEEMLRAQIRVDLEPVWAAGSGLPYPLDAATAVREARTESSLYFSASIYGWSYYYEPGEKARAIGETLELTSLGSIDGKDEKLAVVSSSLEGSILNVWTEFRVDAIQQRYWDSWRTADTKAVQATGHAPLSAVRLGDSFGKDGAMKDAARAAIRSWLRTWERNRPKEVRGRIALAATPRFWIDQGQWACAARFRLTVEEIVPFSVY